MRRKIVGVTVGTTINPKTLEKKLKPVKTVNGVEPDENGNVQVGGSAEAVQANLDAHTGNKKNPHGVTAAQVGARPEDWTPTAEEVRARPDDWMPTAEEVRARPDNWMPNASDVGAAPAGYGLGETSKHITDLNTCIVHGWYWISSSTANVPDGFQYGSCFVRTRTANQITQFLYDHLGFTGVGGYKMIRSSTDGGATWTEEWENPPMIPGEEYRTTKRHNGKAVWTSLTKIAGLPNSEYGMYNLEASYVERMIGKHISYERADGADFLDYVEAGKVYFGNYGSPYIVFDKTQADLSTTTAWVTLEYTKTTD